MLEIIIYIIGGFLGGVATGLVGLSAATIIAPLFVTVLGMHPYTAVGIALASDVFGSSLSAFHYIKNKNIHLKAAAVMAVTVVVFTILTSYLSTNVDASNLGVMLNVVVVLLGLRFLIFPVKENANKKIVQFTKSKFLASVLWGAVIGSLSGYFGTGGGLSMLVVLTVVLGYDLKTGVGTSVFIMVFTALVGSVSHIVFDGGTIWIALVVTSIAALAGANLSSKFANKIDHKLLNIVIGSLLLVFGIVLIILYFN